jgi:hypothetical protein
MEETRIDMQDEWYWGEEDRAAAVSDFTEWRGSMPCTTEEPEDPQPSSLAA